MLVFIYSAQGAKIAFVERLTLKRADAETTPALFRANTPTKRDFHMVVPASLLGWGVN